MDMSDEPLGAGLEEFETVRKGKCERRKLVAYTLHGNFDVKNEMCNKRPLSFKRCPGDERESMDS